GLAGAASGGGEERRGWAGGGQGGGELLPHEPGLSHAGHADAPAAALHEGDRLLEAVIQPVDEGPHRLSLGLKHSFSDLEDVVGRKGFAHGTPLRAAPIARSSRRSRGRRASGSIVGPSDGARSGSSWTSMNTASTPKATAARAKGSTYWRSPPERVPSPPGSCTACVASKTTGTPRPRITRSPRKSTTRLLYPKVAPRSVRST